MRLPEDVAILVALKLRSALPKATPEQLELACPVACEIVRTQMTIDTIEAYRIILGVRR